MNIYRTLPKLKLIYPIARMKKQYILIANTNRSKHLTCHDL